MVPGSTDEVDLRLKIGRRVTSAEGVIVLDLIDPSGQDLPRWDPGAHVDLALPNGLSRQYSLCGDPSERKSWKIAVLREAESRGGSSYVHQKLCIGAEVHVQGLRNHFLLERCPNYIFVAGGIGITPILPMIAAARAAGAEWVLHYGGRRKRSMAFLEGLEGATRNQVTLHPQDEVGLMDLPTIIGPPRVDTMIYCCGPEPLLDAVEKQAHAWPEGSLRMERFAPKDLSEPTFDGEFEVELAYSNLTLVVPPEKSVLEVLEEAGAPVISSCQDGTCGTCETPVLEGAVDHRDSVMTPAEQALNDRMYVCVSRAACPTLVLGI